MKSYYTYFLSFLIGGSLLSCSEDENNLTTHDVIVEFNQTQISITENGNAVEVILPFSNSLKKDGTITVDVTTENFNSFATDPEIIDGTLELTVTKGSTQASFTILPVNDNLLGENKTIAFNLSAVSDGLSLGSKRELTTTLIDDESPTQVNFMLNIGTVRENSASGSTVMLILSHAAPGNGTIELVANTVNGTYGTHYVTEPATINGKITLPIETGILQTSFKVIPLNDYWFNNERKITYTLTNATGVVRLGTELTYQLSITDDESYGMPKGYQTGAFNNWSNQRIIVYNAQGLIANVNWSQNATSGSDTYHYNLLDMLVKKTSSDFSETTYFYEGRITKEETVKDGVIKKYVLYGYDQAGNVGEASFYYRQPSGELLLGLVNVYLYYTNGNLYKKLVYYPHQDSEELTLIQEETYEHYIQKFNPFPIEIIPGVPAQTGLPTKYTYTNNGETFTYTFDYEFNDNDQVTKRISVRNNLMTDVTQYLYY
jgi:hypothetical protein